MLFGYVRVSTTRQKLDRQIDNIKKMYPDALIVSEKYTGTKVDRPEWNKLYKNLKDGDTVVFDSVSRMSRNASDGFKLYMDLYDKGVSLKFIKEPMIDTEVFRKTAQVALTGTDADCIIEGVNKYLMLIAERQVQIAFDQAEKEVNDLHQRISEGIRQTQLKGNHVGRVKGRTYTTKKSIEQKEKIRELSKSFEGTLSDKKVMEYTGLSRNTFYKYKKQLLTNEEELNMEKMKSNFNDELYTNRGEWIANWIEEHIDSYMEENDVDRDVAEKYLEEVAENEWQKYYDSEMSKFDDEYLEDE